MSKVVGNKILGNNLRIWRAKFELTQSELAQKAGVSRKTISTLERGVYTPSVALALTISNIFDTAVEQVFYLK